MAIFVVGFIIIVIAHVTIIFLFRRFRFTFATLTLASILICSATCVVLIADGVFVGEKALQAKWLEVITPILEKAGLVMPDVSTLTPVYGGRNGYHSEHLQPLITEMSEVCRLDPTATW